MVHTPDSRVTAVLGPTNTGKTHLAVERMCAHSSGIMGFPLRLLAREVYDRVVAIKGAAAVGLITGEERILPDGARWILCTAESMPLDRDAAFVALDEAQLAQNPERGHVFTDRILRARGREETMILGSQALHPIVKSLVPGAEIISRPRFSQLSYAGPKKLSRLPPRSVIVAFSADQVYALAEALRRTHGGAAVVMGALSPRTRNAQVGMFQSGEVDYLIATDAVGMGLNLDVGHVAFAGLTKFDGKKKRRLSPAEMAQIAGRAGRHQRDGSFGTLATGDGAAAFSDDEIERIENHRFSAISKVFWRNADHDFRDIDALIGSLELLPCAEELVLQAAPEAVDLAVLKALANDNRCRALARQSGAPRRLWDACGLPDFRKLGVEHHAQLAGTIFGHIADGGVIPTDWIAREVSRLDTIQGDIDTLAGRIAAARTWAYVSHRADWLAAPAHWAERTRALETKLSDALHKKLTERFVDRRTSVLMRSMHGGLPSKFEVADDGLVSVEDEPIGALDGFQFVVDPSARLGDRKRLLAAAEQRLPAILADRAGRLATAPDMQLAIDLETGAQPGISWRGNRVATIVRGRDFLTPALALEPSVRALPAPQRAAISLRLDAFLCQNINRHLAPLVRISAKGAARDTPPPLRAVLAQLAGSGGLMARADADVALTALDAQGRRALHHLGIIIGTLDLFHPGLLKPGAAQMRLALHAVFHTAPLLPAPMPGLGLLDQPSAQLAAGAKIAGYRRFGSHMLRVDLVERIARSAHDRRGSERDFTPDLDLATSLGIGGATLVLVLRALGFHQLGGADATQWRWKGRERKRVRPAPINAAFAGLAAWRDKG